VLRPKATAALSVAPATVTDRNCAAVLGLEGREFRDLLVREHVPHARRGQRVIARVEDVLLVVDRLASASSGPAPASTEPSTADDGGPGVDGILARIGLRRAG